MKILYICLNFEGMQIKNNFYGGGSVFAPHAREKYYNFHIAASKECFDGCSKDEKTQNNIILSQKDLEDIGRGMNLGLYIHDLKSYDLIVHHHLGLSLNIHSFHCFQAVWGVGYMEKVHPNNKNVLFFNYDLQKPIFDNVKNHNIYHIQMGRPIPEFKEYKREDFLLQITNQHPCFNGSLVAQFCKRNKIKCYFGGPIAEHYNLLDHIDNKNTFYLGVVDMKTKIDYITRARAFVCMNSYPAPFSLSSLEALSYGCPVIGLPVGFFPSLIVNGLNGFLVDDEKGFLASYILADKIKQIDCYNSATKYSVENMLKSFSYAFTQIVYS